MLNSGNNNNDNCLFWVSKIINMNEGLLLKIFSQRWRLLSVNVMRAMQQTRWNWVVRRSFYNWQSIYFWLFRTTITKLTTLTKQSEIRQIYLQVFVSFLLLLFVHSSSSSSLLLFSVTVVAVVDDVRSTIRGNETSMISVCVSNVSESPLSVSLARNGFCCYYSLNHSKNIHFLKQQL